MNTYEEQQLWDKQRQKALKRDNYKCRECGTTQQEHKQLENIPAFWKGTGLHIHHIKRRATFDSIREAHKLDNLKTLCYKCHDKQEKHNLPD